MGSRLVGLVSLVLLQTLAWALYLVGGRVRGLAGAALGALARAGGFRDEVVRQNLLFALPSDELALERGRLQRNAYSHLGRLALEVLLLFGPMRRFARRKGRLEGLEHWREAKRRGRGVIFLSSHVGNWEVMASIGAVQHGIDILLVTKHLKPEWLHRAVERGRLRCGVRATYEPRTFRDVLSHLKGNGTVGIVLDQYAGPPVGLRVPFFDVPVGTHSVVATLAKRTGAPVLPVVNHRLPDGCFKVRIEPPLPWIEDVDPARELALNTAEYARTVERHVRERPDQWLWVHRRFKGDLSPLRESEWLEGRARR